MIYFASDFHLGIDLEKSSREREQMICRWLDEIASDAEHIYLLGDLFDFWFEYKRAVPKGFVRLLGKLAEISDKGIPIEVFTGNHDMWMRDYFISELGIRVHRKPILREHHDKRFLIGHGDGLGPGDKGYKILKRIFANSTCQWLFARIHPNLGIKVAQFWSGRSRNTHGLESFLGVDKEWLVQYCEYKKEQVEVDYFVFGHRHLPVECRLSDGKTMYYNLGDWMYHMSYGKFDGHQMSIEFYDDTYADRLVRASVDKNIFDQV